MRPKIILHSAISLDGRNTGFEVDMEVYYRLASSFGEDATLVGSGTVLAAPESAEAKLDPDWTAAQVSPDDKRPLLVIPDSRGRIKTWHSLLSAPYWKGGVSLCSQLTPREHLDLLERIRIPYLIKGEDHADLPAAMESLHDRFGIRVIRADCGGTLNGILISEGLADRLSLLIHPEFSSAGGDFFYKRPGGYSFSEPKLRLSHREVIGKMMWLIYDIDSPVGE